MKTLVLQILALVLHGSFSFRFCLFQRQIQDPELTTKLNKPTCSGVMLYGPPGCGKTKVAKVSGDCLYYYYYIDGRLISIFPKQFKEPQG